MWNVVVSWEWFPKDTVGKQFVRAIDSISANIAVPSTRDGRFGKKDKIKFYRYSMGSTKEFFDWNEKSKIRKLLKIEEYEYIFKELDKLPKKLNSLIKYTNEKLTI